jgi:uncharacterized protein (TIGR04255 family)
LLRVVIPFEQESAAAILTQSLPESSQDCIFDIDVIALAPQGISESETWSKLEALRDIKNRLFFQSLTAEALERFK